MALKKLPLFVLILLILSAVWVLSVDMPLSREDSARIEASVLGFDKDENNKSFIYLTIDKILNYTRVNGSFIPPIHVNDTHKLGFLWGHSLDIGPYYHLEIGDKIRGDIGIHFNFSSHTGHLYNYELICTPNEQKIEGICVPLECKSDEILEDRICKPLHCDEDEVAVNHFCTKLSCSEDQIPVEHKCVQLVCESDEYVQNHNCLKLNCAEDEEIKEHSCVRLVCGIFRKPTLHQCTFDWLTLSVFFFTVVFVLSILYEAFLKKLIENKRIRYYFLRSKLVFVLIILITLFLLLLPSVFRLLSNNALLIGEETIHNTYIAERFAKGEQGFWQLDNPTEIYNLLIGYSTRVLGLENSSRFVPILLGILSACIFFSLLRWLINDLNSSLIGILILIASPGFIYLFVSSTPLTLIAFSLLLGIFLSRKEGASYIIVSSLLFLLASSYSPFVLVLSSLIQLYLFYAHKSQKKLRQYSLFAVIGLGVLYHILTYHFISHIQGFGDNLLRESITEFGALEGFGIFFLILSILGIINSWTNKREYWSLYLSLLGLGVLSLIFDENYNLLLNFIMVVFAARGFVSFTKRKWENKNLKAMTILIIGCGLLFSTISYSKQLSLLDPQEEMVASLYWLREKPGEIVLTYYSYAPLIRYYAKKTPFVDEYTSKDPLFNFNISQDIFYSRNLERTSENMENNQINYILVDTKMKKTLVWKKEEQGLLFLFRNNETFKRIYNSQGIEIWEYMSQKKPEK